MTHVFCCTRRPSIKKEETILVVGGNNCIMTVVALNPSGGIWGTWEIFR